MPMMLPSDLSKLKFLQPVSIMSLLQLGSSIWHGAGRRRALLLRAEPEVHVLRCGFQMPENVPSDLVCIRPAESIDRASTAQTAKGSHAQLRGVSLQGATIISVLLSVFISFLLWGSSWPLRALEASGLTTWILSRRAYLFSVLVPALQCSTCKLLFSPKPRNGKDMWAHSSLEHGGGGGGQTGA